MEFNEIKRSPEFTLKLSLGEAISLWKIVNFAHEEGNDAAKAFVDELYEFARDSNSYSEYLSE